MSSLGISQMNQLANKLDAMGWNEERVTQFGQAPKSQFRDFEAIMDGRATVTMNRRLTTSTVFYITAAKNPKWLEDCEGVWQSSNATKLFANVAKLPAQKRRQATHCDLVEGLNDFDIIKDLGGEEAVVFASVETLETAISQLVTKQTGGKPGELLNDGKTNIFYVRNPNNSGHVLYVFVSWFSGGSEWRVYSGVVSTHHWPAGDRVFPTTAAA